MTDASNESASAAVKTPAAPWNLPFTLRADDETWTLGDSDGRTVVIARRGADVFVVDSGGALRFQGVKRDLFARCFEAAGRSADEAAPAAGTKRDEREALESADRAYAKLHPDPYRTWVNGEQPAPGTDSA